MNKQQEPRLRFKGFTGNWEENVLEEVVNFFSGLTYSPNDVVKNGTLVLRSSNVQDNQITTEDNVFVKESAVNCRNVEVGDVIVVVRNGSRSLIGKHAIIKENMPNTVIGAFMTGVRSNQPDFLNALLDSYKFNQEIEKNLGATINQITTGAFRKMEFSLPSLPEQTHLGLFFRRLDSQIAESRAVLEKSRQLKKAMLAKMFPAKGEKIPKIRFKGFDGEWECRKLRDLMNVTSVKRIHQSDWTNEGVRFLRARDIVAFNKGERIEEPLFISKEKYNEYSELSGKVKIGDLLVTGVGTIGVPYLIEDEDPLYFKDGNVIWFQNENKIGGLFFYYSFLNNFIQDFIIETAGIGTVGTYTIDTGKKTPIFLPPTKSEQTAIGLFFRQLDETIALQSAEIEKLNQLKKGLLAAMLV